MPALAFPLLAVAVAVAIAPTTHALTCKAFFQQNTDKYDKQQLPTHECSHSELGDCSVDGLAANHCVPFRRAGQGTGANSSMLKYYGTEYNKRRFEILMDMGGSDELEWEGERTADGKRARNWLRTKANSIEGGTSEVQLNIVAKRILELPGA